MQNKNSTTYSQTLSESDTRVYDPVSDKAHSDSIEFICAIQKNSYVCMYVKSGWVRSGPRVSDKSADFVWVRV